MNVSVGSNLASCIDKTGRIWTWGNNAAGELGHGDFEPCPEPKTVALLHSKNVDLVSCGGGFVIALGHSRNHISSRSTAKQELEARFGGKRESTRERSSKKAQTTSKIGFDKARVYSPASRRIPLRQRSSGKPKREESLKTKTSAKKGYKSAHTEHLKHHRSKEEERTSELTKSVEGFSTLRTEAAWKAESDLTLEGRRIGYETVPVIEIRNKELEEQNVALKITVKNLEDRLDSAAREVSNNALDSVMRQMDDARKELEQLEEEKRFDQDVKRRQDDRIRSLEEEVHRLKLENDELRARVESDEVLDLKSANERLQDMVKSQ